jgi:hypothetical protein
MSAPKKFLSEKSLRSLVLLGMSVPISAITWMQTARADTLPQCVPAVGVSVCVRANPASYLLYTQIGEIASQPVSVGNEGGCPVFGAMHTANGYVRVEGCITPGSTPPQLKGAAKICNSSDCRQAPVTLTFPNVSLSSGQSQVKGFELYLDGVRVMFVPATYTRQEIVEFLELAKRSLPDRKVEGYLDGKKIGYELFWDGVRIGFEPSWTRQQAIDNLQANKNAYPSKRVEGTLDGQKLGYELFWDGIRIGFEPSWTRQQAIDNLQWNKNAYPSKRVEGTLDGQKVGYELFWYGVRIGFEPGWTMQQANSHLQWMKQTYPNGDVVGLFNGTRLP